MDIGAAIVILISGVAVVAVSAVWVVRDATDRTEAGRPVVARIGPVELSRPEHWILACMFFWVFAFPMYLVARRS